VMEALAAASCKATFPLMGSAWALTVCEGMWGVAAVALPSLLVLGMVAWYPGRLRGNQGGGAWP
jgi:hypothetical protein